MVTKITPEKQEAVFLFCDLLGFTKLADDIKKPDVVAKVLIEFYDTISQNVSHYEPGILFCGVNKFINDGVFAIFLPLNANLLSLQRALTRAICGAFRICEDFEELYKRWEIRLNEEGFGKINVETIRNFGIGISIGHAHLGILEGSGWSDFVAVGSNAHNSYHIANIAGKVRKISSPASLQLYPRILLPRLTEDYLKDISLKISFDEKDDLKKIDIHATQKVDLVGVIDVKKGGCGECKNIDGSDGCLLSHEKY